MNYMTEFDALAQYDDALRDLYGDVTVCGMVMDAVDVLKEMDETAYNNGFSDYCDSMDIDTSGTEDDDEDYLGGDDEDSDEDEDSSEDEDSDEDELAVIAADAGRVSFT